MSQPDLTGATMAPNIASSLAGVDTSAPAVRAAIARAASATGVDFSYLLAQAKLESSLDPGAHAGTSSAAGLYQFTSGTWLSTLQKHGGALGGDADATNSLAALNDPAARSRLMAMRYDPSASAMMAAELAGDNQTALTSALGRTPDASELYLAHFLGADGATKFLSAMTTDPSQSAAALLPKATAANHGIFYDGSGAPRSLGGVMAMLRTRVTNAMQDSSGATAQWASTDGAAAAAPAMDPNMGPIARQFTAAQSQNFADGGSGSGAPAQASMADTLRATFALNGDGSGASTPDFVRNAYGKMQALGL